MFNRFVSLSEANVVLFVLLGDNVNISEGWSRNTELYVRIVMQCNVMYVCVYNVNIYLYIYIYVCMYEMYVCMYVCMQ